MSTLSTDQIWQELASHAQRIETQSTRDWFDSEPQRMEKMVFNVAGIRADFSKQRIDQGVHQALLNLARAADVPAGIAGMFSGAQLNPTEQRAVLHVALRDSVDHSLNIDSHNVAEQVSSELERMLAAVDQIRNGDWKGYTGQSIRDVVHIGIGGSDLGPRMVTRTLTPQHDNAVNVHFVANLDAHEMAHRLANIDAESTLFLIASKSFGTEETLCNAKLARQFIVDKLGDEKAVARHMLALSSNSQRVAEFGIDPANRFEFWDWVGGRFSVWSVIGMPIALAIGSDGFREFLRGANAMDVHFRDAPLEKNLPVMMALAGLWNRNMLGHGSQAIVPYYHFMDLLPQYLQQAEMESNGKRVNVDGELLQRESAPVIWGSAGTDAQHAYFQLLHQGTEAIPVDFIASLAHQHGSPDSHQRLLTHVIAQSEALLCGRAAESAADELRAHQQCPGNRPNTLLLLEQVSPATVGALLALYEHKIFVSGFVLGINSFDQFGVELGKQLAAELLPMVQGKEPVGRRDQSTEALLALARDQFID